MARNQELQEFTSAGWIMLTNSNTTHATFQVKHGSAEFRVSVGTTAPDGSDPGILLREGEGEANCDLAAYFQLTGANRLWARRATQNAGVMISHA